MNSKSFITEIDCGSHVNLKYEDACETLNINVDKDKRRPQLKGITGCNVNVVGMAKLKIAIG